MRFLSNYKVFFCSILLSMACVGMEAPNKSIKEIIFEWIGYGNHSKHESPAVEGCDLPEEIWRQIGFYLEIPDYYRLTFVNKKIRKALTDPKIVDAFVSERHFFQFPLFQDEKPNSLQPLINSYSFIAANGEPLSPTTIKINNITDPQIQIDLSDVIKYQCWHSHMHALYTDGIIYVWCPVGFHDCELKQPIPHPIKGALEHIKIIDVVFDENKTTVLSSDGKVFAWDHQDFLAVVNPTLLTKGIKTSLLIEDDLKGEKIIAIKSNEQHSLALSTDGQVFLIKHMVDKQMNIGAQRLEGPWKSKRIIGIYAKGSQNVVLSENGKFYGWGNNGQFSLGLKSEKIYFEPTAYDKFNKSIIAIKLIKGGCFILNKKGQVFFWGNRNELLCDPNEPDRFLKTIIKKKFKGKKVINIQIEDDVRCLFFSGGTSHTFPTTGTFNIPGDLYPTGNGESSKADSKYRWWK